MSPRSFSLATTSASSLARASAVSVALLNSNSSVEAMLMIAGVFGCGAATGSAARGATTGAGAGAGAAAGASGLAAGLGASLAQPAISAVLQRTLKIALFVLIDPPRFLRADRADL